MELALWLYILEEHNLKEVSFEENVDQSWSHLDDSDVEEESWAKNGQMDIVVNTSKAIIMFVL